MTEEKATSFRIPRNLWLKFKAKVALEGKTVKQVLIQLIKDYLEEKGGKNE